MKRGPTARFALEIDRAPVLVLDDLSGDGEAEARAFAQRLRGEAGLKRFGLLLGVMPRPVSAIEMCTSPPSSRVRTVIFPSPSIACPAFTSRFRKTWFSICG